MKKTVLLFVFVLSVSLSFSQDDTFTNVTPESALAKVKVGNYEEALGDFLQLLNDDNKNDVYNYNVGVCYLNTNINKAKAVPYLEIVTRKEKFDPNALYLLGRAYHYANRFDDAIAMFNKFKQDAKGTIFNLVDADLQIQHCINAKELIKFPEDVIFQNLGSNINSAYSDYYPFVTEDESFIIYNTKRPEKNAEKMPNGSYLNSIYVSKVINGEYMKASVIGSPVNAGNSGMEIIGLSSKGDIMLLYLPEGMGKGNIYTSKINAQGIYSKPVKLDSKINSGGEEIAASISSDGKTIFFASKRKGGYGGTDIYICKQLINGKWSDPQNAGPDINTPHDEDFPNISPDGKMLYFSSKGHTSMGGYDIFKAGYEELTNEFSKPRNLGFPINTTYDDMNFRISKNGKYGYIASPKSGGQGDFDIYRVTFNEVENDYSVVVGQLSVKEGEKIDYSDVFISVSNNISGELIGNYIPNPANGRFIVILPPGKYQMSIDAPGFKNFDKTIEIFDKVSYQAEMNMNIELIK